MNLPVVVQHEAGHRKDCPKNCFFKVHLHSLNDDEVLVLPRGRAPLVTMGCNAKRAIPLAYSFLKIRNLQNSRRRIESKKVQTYIACQQKG